MKPLEWLGIISFLQQSLCRICFSQTFPLIKLKNSFANLFPRFFLEFSGNSFSQDNGTNVFQSHDPHLQLSFLLLRFSFLRQWFLPFSSLKHQLSEAWSVLIVLWKVNPTILNEKPENWLKKVYENSLDYCWKLNVHETKSKNNCKVWVNCIGINFYSESRLKSVSWFKRTIFSCNKWCIFYIERWDTRDPRKVPKC